MKQHSSLALFIIFCIVYEMASGQETSIHYAYRLYTTKDGLPKIQTTCLFQDNSGYLWIGTRNGLVRYDGVSFITYTSASGNIGSVNSIMQHSSGEMVIYTGQGIRIINGDSVSDLYTDHRYNYYLGNACLLDDKIFLRTWPVDKILNDKSTVAILEFDPKKKKFTLAGEVDRAESELYPISDRKALVFSSDSEKKIWYYRTISKAGLSGRHRLPFHYLLSGKRTKYTNNMIVDKEGNAYVVRDGNSSISFIKMTAITDTPLYDFIFRQSDNSIFYINKKNELVRKQGSNEEKLLQIDIPWCALQDGQGNLWVASEDGLYCFFNFTFKEYKWNFNKEKNDFIWSLGQTADSMFWINNYGEGLWQYNEHEKRVVKNLSTIQPDGKHVYLYYHPVLRNDTLYYPGANCYLIITRDKVRLKYDNRDVNLFFYNDPISGHILSGGRSIRYIDSNLEMQMFIDKGKLHNSGSFVLSMCRDKYGRLWYADGGIGYIDKDGKSYRFDIGKSNGFISILCDHRKNLWFAGTNGIWHYNYQQLKKIQHPALTTIGALHEYKSRMIILSMVNKLGTLNLDSFYSDNPAINIYSANNGFNGTDWSQNSIWEDKCGYVWINTLDKVIRFHPDSLLPNVTPRPFIKTAEVSSDNVHWQPIWGSIEYPNDNLRFSFSAVTFNYSDEIYYKYRLKGFSDWSLMARETHTTYTNLPIRKHLIFEVQATLDGIHWTTAHTKEYFIRPAWYQTYVFYAFIFILGIATIIGIPAWIVYTGRRRRDKEKQLITLQLQNARKSMVPHLTNNVYEGIIHLIKHDKSELAVEYTYTLSRLNNKILTLTEQKSQPLSEEIKFVNEYLKLQQLLYREQFTYEIIITEGVNMSMHVPIMVLHTFAENALKHGIKNKNGRGHIIVKICKLEHAVQLSVSDDGIGRRLSAVQHNIPSTGKGLSILKKLIDISNKMNKKKIIIGMADLKDENGSPIGTTAYIIIPDEYKF